jgi:pimeloyl-ACP methyl ester carboxylesterase
MARKPEFLTVKGDGLNLTAARWGGAEPTVICIHGMAGYCVNWNTIIGRLPHGPRFIAIDLRGRGRSDKPATGYSVEHHRKDILAMMDSLDIETAVMMGHSLGAMIALSMAAHNPQQVEKLILVDGGGELSLEQRTKVLDGIKPTLDRLGKLFPSVDAYLDLMKAAPTLQPWTDDLEENYRYDIEEVEGGVRSRVAAWAVEEEISNLSNLDALAMQKQVNCPTLILRADRGMVAENDLLLPYDVAETMLANIKNSALVNVAGANHYSIILKPQPVRDAAIKAFLGI